MMDHATEMTKSFMQGFVELSLLYFSRRVFGTVPHMRMVDDAIRVVPLWILAFFLQRILKICDRRFERVWAGDSRAAEVGCAGIARPVCCYRLAIFR